MDGYASFIPKSLGERLSRAITTSKQRFVLLSTTHGTARCYSFKQILYQVFMGILILTKNGEGEMGRNSSGKVGRSSKG